MSISSYLPSKQQVGIFAAGAAVGALAYAYKDAIQAQITTLFKNTIGTASNKTSSLAQPPKNTSATKSSSSPTGKNLASTSQPQVPSTKPVSFTDETNSGSSSGSPKVQLNPTPGDIEALKALVEAAKQQPQKTSVYGGLSTSSANSGALALFQQSQAATNQLMAQRQQQQQQLQMQQQQQLPMQQQLMMQQQQSQNFHGNGNWPQTQNFHGNGNGNWPQPQNFHGNGNWQQQQYQ